MKKKAVIDEHVSSLLQIVSFHFQAFFPRPSNNPFSFSSRSNF